jgi:D-alanyl-D-alanine carboxypeptidase
MNHNTFIRLQTILDRAVDGKRVFGTTFAIRHRNVVWSGGAGNLAPNDRYFIASTTKLFVTALLVRFEEQQRLRFSDPIANFLPEPLLRNLQSRQGRDNVPRITLKDLLAHTSGIPDYFQGRDARGESLEREILHGVDRSWTFEDAVARSKTLAPPFDPGARRRALYSDTNFQILGRVLEIVSGRSFDELVQENITGPLQLADTYLYRDPSDATPAPLYYRDQPLRVPRAMTSFGPDGGAVSTASEMLRFVDAFFNGTLFPAARIETLKVWNPIFFPLQSGIGIHRFQLPRLFDPFRAVPDLIGHSGLSGALAFHAPEHDLSIAGTVNQIESPGRPFKLAIKLIRETLRHKA